MFTWLRNKCTKVSDFSLLFFLYKIKKTQHDAINIRKKINLFRKEMTKCQSSCTNNVLPKENFLCTSLQVRQH